MEGIALNKVEVEQRLREAGKRLEAITAPDDMETRLRSALGQAAPMRRRRRMSPLWKMAAILLLVTAITGNQYNAFAYYGKQLLGFEELTSGTLRQLNEQGMGQAVDKHFRLADGTDLTLNGMLSDANQLVLYYTLANPAGVNTENSDGFRPEGISGFWSDSRWESGVSQPNADGTEWKGMMTFGSVSPFAKKLTFHFSQLVDGRMKEEAITFPYNPNQALPTQLRQTLTRKVPVDNGTIHFRTITATPTSTVITGQLKLAKGSRMSKMLDGMELWADGTAVPMQGSGRENAGFGDTFDLTYDVLPQGLKSLELVVKTFPGYAKLDLELPLGATSGDRPIAIGDKSLWVKKSVITDEGLELTIATEEDVLLDGVTVENADGSIPLRTTVRQEEVKQADGTLLKERTLLFDATREPDKLRITGMHYLKVYDKHIAIPLD